MQITSVSTRTIQPTVRASGDPVLDGLRKAKETLTNQMQSLKQDQSLSPDSKETKRKQLQAQIDEIDKQMQTRQQEKRVEDRQKAEESNRSSAASDRKTDEEQKKDAQFKMDHSLISTSVHGNQLNGLGSIRRRIFSEDGGYSDRVRRTEEMMGDRIKQVKTSIAKNQEAQGEYNEFIRNAQPTRNKPSDDSQVSGALSEAEREEARERKTFEVTIEKYKEAAKPASAENDEKRIDVSR
ncbi:FlxA-like family protein [Gorillibacterium sp. CAU 1737]|uniref:FlxA-like family protein n=1 Tax=Gorillibacterium sp. CAU 1737 TaxID=3140362 RepID=UPI0032617BF9